MAMPKNEIIERRTIMITVKQNMDFYDIRKSAWGQAVEVLDEIYKAGLQNALMEYLEDIFNEGVDIVELNDLLSYDWAWVYSQIGMPSDVAERLADEENADVE